MKKSSRERGAERVSGDLAAILRTGVGSFLKLVRPDLNEDDLHVCSSLILTFSHSMW